MEKTAKSIFSSSFNKPLAEKTPALYKKFDSNSLPSFNEETDSLLGAAKSFLAASENSLAKDLVYSLLVTCQRQRECINALNSLSSKILPRLDKLETTEQNRTIVISGPSLPIGKSIFEQRILDQKLCNNICDYLSIPSTPIVSRFPSPNENKKKNNNVAAHSPSLIKILLPNIAFQRQAVVNAKKLRNDPRFDGIYLNPFRTPEQQRCYNRNRSLVQSLRQKKISAVLYKQQVYINNNGKLSKFEL